MRVCVRAMNTLNTVCRNLHVVMGSKSLAPMWNSLAKADCEFVFAFTSTGHRLMASLGACQTSTLAEDLISSQSTQHLAHIALRCNRRNVWRVGSWNVRSMVDTRDLLRC